MGKIEEILIAIEPLNHLFFHDIITYYVKDGRFDVFRAPVNSEIWRILFHLERKGISAYFILYPHYQFIKDRIELAQRNEAVIFSIQNVFRYLDIQYSAFSNGDLDDLHELSIMIRDNFPKLNDAFSEKNIEKTYTELISTTGNNEDEINDLLKTARGWN